MKTALEIAVHTLLQISKCESWFPGDVVDLTRKALIEMSQSANGEIVRSYIATEHLNGLKL